MGERLEAAAIREIGEETGIAVDGLGRIDMAEIVSRDAAGAVEFHAVLVVFAGALCRRHARGRRRCGRGAVDCGRDELGRTGPDGGYPARDRDIRIGRHEGPDDRRGAGAPAGDGSTARPGAEGSGGGPPAPAYQADMLRLSEILGAVQFLRELCGTDEGSLWRDQMQALIDTEQPDAVTRARHDRPLQPGLRKLPLGLPDVHQFRPPDGRPLPAGRCPDCRRNRGPLREMMVNQGLPRYREILMAR